MQVARLNLIDWHHVGQQPFARLARSWQVEGAMIARCQAWAADHLRDPSPMTAMVRLSGVAERSFKRRFRAATGLSPLAYVHTLRLEAAKELFEAGASFAGPVAHPPAARLLPCSSPASHRSAWSPRMAAIDIARDDNERALDRLEKLVETA